ncbi:MAG: hypothetical protein ACLGPM_10280 [Acidobacteriota bacterium]
MNIDSVLWLAGTAGEAIVIALLIYRRMWRAFPFFFSYSVWTLISSAAGYALFRSHFAGYAMVYLGVLVVDSALLFGVLVELVWAVLRPLRPAPPRRLLYLIIGLILVIGAAIWPLARIAVPPTADSHLLLILHLQQTFYLLRVVVFLGIACCSQFLAIGWRDRELQIATGLGFNAVVSLAVAMLYAYPSMNMQFHHLDELVIASYLCSLLYWTVSFAQPEQARREFSPQMQSMLLAVAGTAHAARVALQDPAHGTKKLER